MWKLNHWLFGWDYVYWENSATQGISRVYKAESGQIYFYQFKVINVIKKITHPDDVLWLTCSPSKYFEDYDD